MSTFHTKAFWTGKSAFMKYRPHDYQKHVLTRMDQSHILALLLDPGMGKTSLCLEDFRRRVEMLDVTRCLVVAPLQVAVRTWPEEIRKWEGFRYMRFNVAHEKGRTVSMVNRAAINIINPEGLEWLLDNMKDIEPFGALYVDESTLFKKGTNQRCRRLLKLAHKINGGIPYRFILTGTPAPKGVADLYGQFKLLDPSILGNTLGEFRRDFGFLWRQTAWGGEWVEGPDSMDLVQKRIKPYSVRLDASDHLNMPDLMQVRRLVPMPPGIRRLYKKLKKEMYIKLKGGDVVAVNPGVLSMKCRQVANGAIYLSSTGEATDGETRKIEYLHQAKAEALADLFRELSGKPLLVAYEFNHDLTMIKQYIKQEFGFTPRYIGGKTKQSEKNESLDLWDKGELPMLLVNPASAARGLNLQAGGHHLCWYSLTWDLEFYEQLNRRLWRQGQPEGVFIHHLIMEDSVDEVIWIALIKKATKQNDLLKFLKQNEELR